MMKPKKLVLWIVISGLILTGIAIATSKTSDDKRIVSYTAQAATIKMYWKDDYGVPLKSISRLKEWVETRKQTLVFAMNGGMYRPENIPQGLFIENGITRTPPDTSSGNGNFYLKPNGVFYVTAHNKAVICATEAFKAVKDITYATQSGPMLVIDGKIHPEFKEGSSNVNIRNGVGILPDGKVVFAISASEINLYDFAAYFKALGCRNALYFDGYVSRMYLPEKQWTQTDGNFGVMIGVTKP